MSLMASTRAGVVAGEPMGIGEPIRADGGVDLTRVRYRSEGHGAPLLLLNGLFQSLDAWDPVVEKLTPHARIVRLDLPNQGGPTRPAGYLAYADYCQFVRSFIHAVGLPAAETTVFGFSFGAEIARTLHFEMGVPFRRLVLGSVAPPGLERFWPAFFANLYHLASRNDLEAFVRALAFQFFGPQYIQRRPKLLHLMFLRYDAWFGDTPDALLALLRAPWERDFTAIRYTAATHCPIHIVAPTHDTLVPARLTTRYARALNAQLHRVEAGHTFPVENPTATVGLLRRILDVSGRGAPRAAAAGRGSGPGTTASGLETMPDHFTIR